MKALRTKVILSGIVLVFAFIATIGTTFAWFTVSDTVTVESMELNVTTEDNLLIKVFETGDVSPTTLSEYSSSVSNADITTAYSGFSTWQIGPVTALQNYDTPSIDATSLTTIDALTATRPIDGTATSNAAGGDYIQLQFWLYSQSASTQYIELNNLTLDVASLSEANSTEQDDVINAVRIAVYEDGATAANAYIYGLDTLFDFEWGTTDPGYYSGGSPSTINGFNSLFEINLTDATGDITAGSTSVTNSGNIFDNATLGQDILALAPETPTLVTVSIFIEGWDSSATNLVMDARFNIAFSFIFGTQDV